MRYWLLLAGFLLFSDIELFAQDYSEYEHLWADPKAEKKRRKKEEKLRKKQARETPPLVVADTLVNPTDSIPNTNADSLPDPQSQVTPMDSVDQVTEEIPEIIDSTQVQDVPEPIVEVIEEPEEEEIKPEKEKKEVEPQKPDFRAGMASGGGSMINGGFTFTQIADENYVGLSLQPEFAIWKIGVGLNIPILYGLESQKIRTEMFKDGVGLARVFTYIRYGVQKVDPVYVKVGTLNGTMIGFGGLVNNYTNSTSFEKRKLGAHWDINYKGFGGVEGMYSDFDPGSTNLFVLRPYVRPLSFLDIPIVRTLEFGTTIVSDKDQTEIPLSDSTSFSYTYTAGGIGAFGLDAGLNLLNVPFIQIDAFLNWSKLKLAQGGLEDSIASFTPNYETLADGYEDGTGFSYGINFRFNFIADVMMTDIRIERLNYSEHYLPQFFDTNYELSKDGKILSTLSAASQQGIYGSLTGHIMQKARLGGSLLLPDEVTDSSPAVIQLYGNVDRLADKFSLYASYFKGNLDDLGDAFSFDERSVAQVRFIYHLNRFLATGVDYYYYWEFNPEAGRFKATQYVSPYFGLSIQF